ncbi:hypothetical protein KKG45_05125 [bacterium]|nr:hypothetical protein [bacterium]MBU1072611.1 hypothetical protein [bacterium]MBU1675744.1 hypothetical protein [bacterium]
MTRKLTLTKLNLFIAAAAVLLVLGLGIEGMLTKPHQLEIRNLLAEKSRLQIEIERQRVIESDSRTVAALVGVSSLAELAAPTGHDAISYLSGLLDEAKLVRLGLTTSGQEDIGTLQATSYTLRAKGDFKQLQDFVQRVENGDRLATIDALRIMPAIDDTSLEGRFNLSIYDVKEER